MPRQTETTEAIEVAISLIDKSKSFTNQDVFEKVNEILDTPSNDKERLKKAISNYIFRRKKRGSLRAIKPGVFALPQNAKKAISLTIPYTLSAPTSFNGMPLEKFIEMTCSYLKSLDIDPTRPMRYQERISDLTQEINRLKDSHMKMLEAYKLKLIEETGKRREAEKKLQQLKELFNSVK